MKCPVCGAAELTHDTRDVPYTYQGETSVIPAVMADFCPACGEFITDMVEADRVMREMQAYKLSESSLLGPMRPDPSDTRCQELAALADIPESAIDFSDLPPLKVDEWRGAVRGKFYRPVERAQTGHTDGELERVAEAFVTDPAFARCRADEALWDATATDGLGDALDRV